MQRTDSEMLDFVLPLVAGKDHDDAGEFDARVKRLTGALMLGMSGREAVAAAMGAQMFEPGEALPPPTALDLVGAEYQRVRTVEGYTADSDAAYAGPYLAQAAAVYVLPEADRQLNKATEAFWPFDHEAFKPTPDDRVRELVKGCVLAVCEIERLQRAVKWEHVEAVETPRPFQVGDRVRIARKQTDWPCWVPQMDAFVGADGCIDELGPDAWANLPVARLGLAGGGFVYPLDCLEHVDG
jgi:hypothetical protein